MSRTITITFTRSRSLLRVETEFASPRGIGHASKPREDDQIIFRDPRVFLWRKNATEEGRWVFGDAEIRVYSRPDSIQFKLDELPAAKVVRAAKAA